MTKSDSSENLHLARARVYNQLDRRWWWNDADAAPLLPDELADIARSGRTFSSRTRILRFHTVFDQPVSCVPPSSFQHR
ncbi:hypothetical protein HII36_23140 [Nonomuraea sp. NN258]|uniref:hypothetical protein n=1 Tax=Nonomuraea antri TaxID=2730852 RepID=UPI001568BA21|nr:hypothetical protein [Nonomuraea antri]NRQ34705.1 hypothetical protein [Nonomuraea antri]